MIAVTMALCRRWIAESISELLGVRSCFLSYSTRLSSSTAAAEKKTNQLKKEDCEMLDLGSNRKVCYKKLSGGNIDKYPGIMFLPGFMSNLCGTKATYLEGFCRERQLDFVRYDNEGLGFSPGDLKNMEFRNWLEDAQTVLTKLTIGPQILVGSSMGAWISLILAQEFPEKVHSIVGIGTAINFMKTYYEMFYQSLPKEAQEKLDSGDVITANTDYGQVLLARQMVESSIQHHLDLKGKIDVRCPVRFVHGLKDFQSPYEKSALPLMKALESKDVDIILRKDGPHQLSRPKDLKLISRVLDTLLQKYPIDEMETLFVKNKL